MCVLFVSSVFCLYCLEMGNVCYVCIVWKWVMCGLFVLSVFSLYCLRLGNVCSICIV